MGLISGLMGHAGVVSAEELTDRYGTLLVEDENIEVGFEVIRDTFIFTDKRLILIDIQGVRGKKTEYLSIPYGSISQFSIETAGTFDLDAELKIWIGSNSIPSIQKKFGKDVDIYELQTVLATHVL